MKKIKIKKNENVLKRLNEIAESNISQELIVVDASEHDIDIFTDNELANALLTNGITVISQ